MSVVVTYLEMREPPSGPPPEPPADVALLRAHPPSVSFYRFLYEEVGRPWQWVDRKRLSDAELAAAIQHPAVDVRVLYASGNPAGYFEIDRRDPENPQLAYFGLVPACTGRGLGRWLLDAALRQAWAPPARRVWLHTCTLDHPAALPLYRKAGFAEFDRREREDAPAERLEAQVAFAREADRLKKVERRTLLTDGSRLENSAEHSWHLALAALVLAEHAAVPVDLSRVVRMLLVHDLVEIDAGDTYAYDPDGHLDQAEREEACARRLFGLLPPDQAFRLRAEWEEFEEGATPEARFAQALDRWLPVLHNYLTGGRQWKRHGVRLPQVLERTAPVREAAPRLWEVLEPLLQEAQRQQWLIP